MVVFSFVPNRYRVRFLAQDTDAEMEMKLIKLLFNADITFI